MHRKPTPLPVIVLTVTLYTLAMAGVIAAVIR